MDGFGVALKPRRSSFGGGDSAACEIHVTCSWRIVKMVSSARKCLSISNGYMRSAIKIYIVHIVCM